MFWQRLPLACILLLGAAPCLAQRFESNSWWNRRVLNIAHAGGECEAPTNTLYALKTALQHGADMLEFDVQSSQDGILVVHHDETVDRVTNGSGRLVDLTVTELKQLDSAYDFTPHGGEGCAEPNPASRPLRGMATGEVAPPDGFAANDFRIATVREVLEAFPDVWMSIEIKGSPAAAVATANRLAELLREFGRSDDVMIASFDERVTTRFKAAAPEIHTTPGIAGMARFLLGDPLLEHQALQVPPVEGGLIFAAPEPIALAHDQGLPMIVFLQEGTETDEIYDLLLDLGVDGVITGRPTAFEAKLRERGLDQDPRGSADSGDGCQLGKRPGASAWVVWLGILPWFSCRRCRA